MSGSPVPGPGSVMLHRAGAADTLLTIDTRDRSLAAVAHGARVIAGRIGADCENMLRSLHQPGRDTWREAVERAYLASRHLCAILEAEAAAPAPRTGARRLQPLAARVTEPQRRIVDAMSHLLAMVPTTVADELLLQDASRVRHAAHTLLAPQEASDQGHQTHGAVSPSAAVPASPERPSRILVVDDEKLLRSLLKRALVALGYDVVEAHDGKEAVERLRGDAVDLVLTDINMPRLDGIALLQLLKSAERTRDIPVIVVSSLDDKDSVARCIQLGAEDHIAKPYEPVILEARVRASLERKRMRDLELDHLRKVSELTAAAEAVEREAYLPGSLSRLIAGDDGIGRLARVFDRMVSGMRSREERLQQRLKQLRREMGTASGSTAAVAADVSTESPFASGQILAARYEILGRLGQGGMGMVYHARDLELGEEIALKVVRRDLVLRDPTLVDRLKSEIRMARRISHRNVVRSHDLGEWQGTYFITMELVQGITVGELLDRRGRLTVESTLAIGTQVAEALAVAHEAQIVHRDIKPANLIVSEHGELKVMDFGLARFVEHDVNLTIGGFVVGTPQYMAPEQLMGGHVDARSDLFALGVTLYECLSGKAPFRGETPLALVSHIADGSVVPLDDLVPEVPRYLAGIVEQLLHADPSHRITSARALAAKLAETAIDPSR